jgi:hypothetical protein
MAMDPTKLSAQAMDAEIDAAAAAARTSRIDALHQPMNTGIGVSPLHKPMGALSDTELLARMELDEGSEFHIPFEEWPAGYVLQWMALEINGMPSRGAGSVMQARRTGWEDLTPKMFDGRFVGRWMPEDHDGPIVVNGLQLMMLPEAEGYNRTRSAYLRARMAKQGSVDMLHQAKAGTGPRTHPQVRPQVNVSIGPMAIE